MVISTSDSNMCAVEDVKRIHRVRKRVEMVLKRRRSSIHTMMDSTPGHSR